MHHSTTAVIVSLGKQELGDTIIQILMYIFSAFFFLFLVSLKGPCAGDGLLNADEIQCSSSRGWGDSLSSALDSACLVVGKILPGTGSLGAVQIPV